MCLLSLVICELNYGTFSCLARRPPPPHPLFVVVTLLFIQRHGAGLDLDFGEWGCGRGSRLRGPGRYKMEL